jgi:hypothetical protein
MLPRSQVRGFGTAAINKPSVEKALDKLRSSDRPNSEKARLDQKMEVLDEEPGA